VTFETREPRKPPEAEARSIVAATKSYRCYFTDVDDRIQSYRADARHGNCTGDHGRRESSRAQTHKYTHDICPIRPASMSLACSSSGKGPRLDSQWPHHEGGEIGTIPPDCHSKK
jgi:hypothetical protein